MTKLPILFLLHPVGDGPTRAMNILSTKLWIRALCDAIPDVVVSAPWLPYAEAMIDRDRGLRDSFAALERHDGAIAVGGEFSRRMLFEWDHAKKLALRCFDLTRAPLPGILTYESFAETRTGEFRAQLAGVFRNAMTAEAA